MKRLDATTKAQMIIDDHMSELDDFMRHVDPAGIMLWIPAAPEDQPEALRKVQAW